jgi:hypothetical protein
LAKQNKEIKVTEQWVEGQQFESLNHYDNTVVKELGSKMFGQHPGYFKAVFLKQTRVNIVSIYKYTVYIMF